MSASLIANKSAVALEFDRIARRYDLATSMSQGYQADLQRSAALLELKGNEHVLDLCCGTGRSSEAILAYVKEGSLTCVDNSKGMLEEARNKFEAQINAGKVILSQQDAMHLDFPEQSFDAVFVAYGLRNMPDYGKFVEGVFRILKPGGSIVIHDYSLSEAWYSKPYWWILGYGFVVPCCSLMTGSSRIFLYLIQSVLRFLSPVEIKALLTKHAFVEVTIHQQPNWRRPILHSFKGSKPL